VEARVKHIIKLGTGWGLVLLGFIGLFLPVLQGILFMLIGFFILSHEYAWARWIFAKLRERFPGGYTRFRAWRRKRQKNKT
jgi:uncharacterized membrane protein YbaN (DUF454 family)